MIDHAATAIATSTPCMASRAFQAMSDNPRPRAALHRDEIGDQIIRLLARRVDVMMSCLVDFAFADVTHRLARRLLLLDKRFGRREGDVVRVKHDLTSEEISQFADVAPGSIGAALRDFEERGWIRFEDSCLEIVNAQGLAAFRAEQ